MQMNANTFNNTALFIKRAEEYQTKEFIIEAFASNLIGKVHDVKLIKKQNGNGINYHGVIVIFERWNMNRLVQTLFNEMSSSPDGTTRFYFDEQRYWIINIHKQKLPECEEFAMVDPSLSDGHKIIKLEEISKSMLAQIYYMQKCQERTERSMMELQDKEMRHWLVNMDLQHQLELKDMQSQYVLDELRAENEALRYKLTLNAIDLVRKDVQIEKLREEVNDEKCILSYVEEDVKHLLNGAHRY